MLRFAAMRRSELILGALGLLLIAIGLRASMYNFHEEQRVIEAGGCRVPVTVVQMSGQPRGSVVLLHGLSANRRTMHTLARALAVIGMRAYALDLPGHGDNTDAFSFESAERCAVVTVEELAKRGEIELGKTALVGHSMGGAIAIRIADKFDTAATVAISPAPLVRFDSAFRRVLPYDLPKKRPNNLLVLSAKYDPGDLKRATQTLARGFGNEDESREAFQSHAALRWMDIPAATHVSLLTDSEAERVIRFWILASSGAEFEIRIQAVSPQQSADNPPVIVITIFPWTAGLPVGMILLFPIISSAAAKAFRVGASNPGAERPESGNLTTRRVVMAWAVVCVLGVLLLRIWVPLRPIGIHTGDYLASFFFLMGLLLGAAWFVTGRRFDERSLASLGMTDARAMAAGTVIGIATFLAIGWWLNTQWTDAWMNAARWWRFAVLAPLLLPYFWAEETAIGWACRRQAYDSVLRSCGMCVLLRTIAWAAMAGALWLLDSQQILIVLMTMFFLGFSVLQRAGANAVGRRAGRAAAASFSAILAAWFIAAVFPLT